MAFDGIVINSLINEFKENLIDGKIEKVYQPEKDELTLVIKKNRKKINLQISVDPSLPHITLIENRRDNPKTPPMFCMLIRKFLVNGKIISINQSGLERIITINVINKNEIGDIINIKLIIEIMGKHSNIILTYDDNTIIDSIKRIPLSLSRKRQILPGLTYFELKSNKINLLSDNQTDIENTLKFFNFEKEVYKNIYMSFDGISPLIAKHLCIESNIDYNLKTLSNNEMLLLKNQILKLKNALINANFNPYIVKNKSNNRIVDYHVIKTKLYEDDEYETIFLSTTSLIINKYFSKKNIEHRIEQKFSRT